MGARSPFAVPHPPPPRDANVDGVMALTDGTPDQKRARVTHIQANPLDADDDDDEEDEGAGGRGKAKNGSHPAKNPEASDNEESNASDDSDDSDDEDDEDDTAQLLAELEKIKRERAEEQARKVCP